MGIFLCLCLGKTDLMGQNLVPNHDFSQFVRCPSNRGQIEQAFPWYSPNYKTTDFAHTCAGAGFAGMPINHWGFQAPYIGEGYAGIRTWLNGDSHNRMYREYLAVRLIDSLEAGTMYKASFYVSPGDSSKFVTDDIGLFVSPDTIPNLDLLPYSPQVRNPQDNFLRSMTSWTKIEGNFRAEGGEQHLVIGNFWDHDNTTVDRRNVDVGFESTYLYIDNVVLEPCSPILPEKLILSTDSLLCPDESLDLAAMTFSGASYNWGNGNTDSTLTISQTGLYTLAITVGGCTWTDSIQITSAEIPVFDLGADTLLCPQTVLEIGLEGSVDNFRWNDRNPALKRKIEEAGTYILEIVEGGCSYSDSINIAYEALYEGREEQDTLVCMDAPVNFKASFENGQYLWSDLSDKANFQAEEAGLYWVDISGQCFQAREYFRLTTQDCGCESFVPNVFSPNGDGIHDTFVPQFREGIQDLQVEIFDSYGRMRFASTNPDEYWDGKWKGKDLPAGVYYWVFSYRCFGGNDFQEVVKKGYVSLLK